VSLGSFKETLDYVYYYYYYYYYYKLLKNPDHPAYNKVPQATVN
jgi:hypothetical protein